jgi:hypothetical protein
MKMNAIVETRVGKINKVTASDWHLSCIHLIERVEREGTRERERGERIEETVPLVIDML